MSKKSIVKLSLILVALGMGLVCIACNQNRDKIWQKNDADLFETLYDGLLKKSDYGDKKEGLNDCEKVFLLMALLESEVNNGGFDQFFFNTNDEWNDLLVSSAQAIKAFDVAQICEKALKIKAKYEGPEEGVIEQLGECDDAFYNSKDYIESLCVQYAREHRDQF